MKTESKEYFISKREKQVLRFVALGLPCKQIANELGIGETTVITYKNRMREKLQVKNCCELIYKALKLGII